MCKYGFSEGTDFFPKWKKVQVADPGAGVYFCECLCQFTLLSEGLTLQTKERRALPMYITYPDSADRDIHLHPCWVVLHNFQGKTKIAANYSQ